MAEVPVLESRLRGQEEVEVLGERELPLRFLYRQSADLLRRYLQGEGLTGFLIRGFNAWMSCELPRQVAAKALEFPNRRFVTFGNLVLVPPYYDREGRRMALLPDQARREMLTYAAELYVDAEMHEGSPDGPLLRTAKGDPVALRRLGIGKIPIMLGSRYCYLSRMSTQERVAVGEDPDDPFGYFVVKGAERVVLLQEQLRINRVFLFNLSTKTPAACRLMVRSGGSTILNQLVLASDKKGSNTNRIEMQFEDLPREDQNKRSTLNVAEIFALLGVSRVREMEEMISLFLDPVTARKALLELSPTLAPIPTEIREGELYLNERLALANVAKKMGAENAPEEEKRKKLNRLFELDLFPHINDLDISSKIYTLAMMTARLLEHLAGLKPMDDRDSWSNKKLEGAGRRMSTLFRQHWNKQLSTLQLEIEKGRVTTLEALKSGIKWAYISDGFVESFKGNWGVKGGKIKENVTQILNRANWSAALAHLHRINVDVNRSGHNSVIRLIQCSQYGYVCPVVSSEGDNCGILKALALTTQITIDKDDAPVQALLEEYVFPSPDLPGEVGRVMLNGRFLGWCDAPRTKAFCIRMRREGIFYRDMGVILDPSNNLLLFTDGDRLVRPLLLVGENGLLEIDNKEMWDAPLPDLFAEQCLELVDTYEQEWIKVASSKAALLRERAAIEEAERFLARAREDLERGRRGEEVVVESPEGQSNLPTLDELERRVEEAKEDLASLRPVWAATHCEIDPVAQLSSEAATIPWPDHNQAPRNVYQTNMVKQALCRFHVNYANRLTDGKTKLLVYPTRPIVEPAFDRCLGLGRHPQGQNVILQIGVAGAHGLTQEDAFLINKWSNDAGMFRIHKYITKTGTEKSTSEITERFGRPDPGRSNEPRDRYNAISLNGLPTIGAYVKQGDCVLGKIQETAKGEIRNESVFLQIGEEGYVDDVHVIREAGEITAIVKIRIMRRSMEGDKYAARCAQKGTNARNEISSRLPFSARTGLVPDMIMSPFAIPSRMTIALLMEIVAAKAGALTGSREDGTAYRPYNLERRRPDDPESYREILRRFGLEEDGSETLISGETGEPFEAKIFVGPCFLQALKHHAIDKIQARSRKGTVKPQTHQPPRGRGVYGGLRFGEMERDASIAHGAASFVQERLMRASDAYTVVYCKKCGEIAVNKTNTNKTYFCNICNVRKECGSFGKIVIPYAFKLLIHTLGPMGIRLRFDMLTREEARERATARPPNPVQDLEEAEQDTQLRPDEYDVEDLQDTEDSDVLLVEDSEE